ncbi:MAG: ATP-binding cassette domain-containing protein [Flavobacteriales bacterium]
MSRLRTLTSKDEPRIISNTFEYHTPLISVNHLQKTYVSSKGLLKKEVREVRAVNDVSFEIMQGETLGLVGESGCGKSTLSRMFLGLIPATGGEVIYEGKNILSSNSAEWKTLRKDLQIIFQDPYSALNPKHTVGDILMEPLSVLSLKNSNEERKQRVLELLDQVGLPKESLNRYPHEFSGGQRQRIVIARALSVEPKFIICDESVAALDVSVQAQVLNLLNDLKRDLGLTYLFISHDLSVVYQMSDRIMVMNKGQIEELNAAWEIFYNPQSDYTKQLLASTI